MMKKLYKAIFYTVAMFLILGCFIMALGSFLHNYHAAMLGFIVAICFAGIAMALYQFFEDQEKAAENKEVKTINDIIEKIKDK